MEYEGMLNLRMDVFFKMSIISGASSVISVIVEPFLQMKHWIYQFGIEKIHDAMTGPRFHSTQSTLASRESCSSGGEVAEWKWYF